MAQTEPIVNQSQMTSQRDENYTSVWMAKKMDQHKGKEIDLLQNRILLLRKEEERTQKKIFDTKLKANQIFQNKKRNEDNNRKKQTNQKHDAEFLKLMQKKSCSLRQAQKNERDAIRKALLDLKKEEANEIKSLSLKNKEAINYTKERLMQDRKNKHNVVKQVLENSRNNIRSYWNERFKYFEDQNENTKYEISRTKSQKEFLLTRLEQEEMDLIKRLQYSQDQHTNACQQLDKVIQLQASEFENQFGPIIQPQKKVVHKKQYSSTNLNRSQFTHVPKKKQYKPLNLNRSRVQPQQQQQQQQTQQQQQQQAQQQQEQQEQQQQEKQVEREKTPEKAQVQEEEQPKDAAPEEQEEEVV